MNEQLPVVGYLPTLPVLLRRAVERYGDDDFVVTHDERVSFHDIERRSRAVAHRLLAAGVGKATRVGIVLPTGIEWVVGWLAAARIGALSMLVPATSRPAELRRATALGDVAVLFAPRTLFGRDYESFLEEAVPTLAGHKGGPIRDSALPYLRSVWLPEASERPWATRVDMAGDPVGDEEMLAAIEAAVSPSDLLLVIYTSGSSADPKAVVHTHGAAIRKIQPELGMSLPTSFPGRTFCATPLFWVGGPQSLLGALHSGATVVLQPRFDPGAALELLEREKCTSAVGWVHVEERLRAEPTFGLRDLSSLAIRAPSFSPRGDPRHLGMTETFGPHGNPEWFEYKVVDPETGTELPEGDEGEFLVRGFGLMTTIYKKEREEVFDRDGWYHTGDRGYIHDGTIWFTGRYSETLKVRGANVAPLEVELVLESLPGVALALVVGVPNEERGQTPAAAIVPEGGATVDPDDLRRLASEQLSAYKVPTRWMVLSSDEVPRLPNGKTDKRTLRGMF